MAINSQAINGIAIGGEEAQEFASGAINTSVINGAGINGGALSSSADTPNIAVMEGSFPPWTMEASAAAVINMEAAFPFWSMEASVLAGAAINMEGDFPAWTSEILLGISMEGSFPAWTVDASVLTGNAINLEADFPKWTMESSSTLGSAINVDVDFSVWTMEAQHFQTNQGNMEGSFPAWTMESRVTSGQFMSMEGSFPAWTSEILVFNPNNISMEGSFPAWNSEIHFAQEAINYIKTIVMNLKNKAVSEYTNFPFESLCSFDNTEERMLGVNSSGLYEITGNKDIAADIDSNIQFGYFDTENDTFQTLLDCYVTSKTGGDFLLELVSEDGTIRPFTKTFFKDQFITRRVQFARSMKNRYYSVRVKNVAGAVLELHKIDLQTILVKEKV